MISPKMLLVIIRLFGFLVLALGLVNFGMFLALLSIPLMGGNLDAVLSSWGPHWLTRLLLFCLLVQSIVGMVSGAGFLQLRDWGRKLTIFLVVPLFIVIDMLRRTGAFNAGQELSLLAINFFINLAIVIAVILFLNWREVKNVFIGEQNENVSIIEAKPKSINFKARLAISLGIVFIVFLLTPFGQPLFFMALMLWGGLHPLSTAGILSVVYFFIFRKILKKYGLDKGNLSALIFSFLFFGEFYSFDEKVFFSRWMILAVHLCAGYLIFKYFNKAGDNRVLVKILFWSVFLGVASFLLINSVTNLAMAVSPTF